MDYEAARRRFKDHCHSPPPPGTMAKPPCLKPPEQRNPEWNATHGDDGRPLDPESCEELVEQMVWKGHWRKVMGESWRSVRVGEARTFIMEFVLPRNGNDLSPYVKEIKLAGYDHFSLCSTNGWQPFKLPDEGKGWGKEVVDPEQLYEWHNQRQFHLPTRHPSGDGWVYKGEHFTREEFPNATEFSPWGDGTAWDDAAFS